MNRNGDSNANVCRRIDVLQPATDQEYLDMTEKTLFLAWQDKRPLGNWFPIGRLDVQTGRPAYRFRYTKGAERARASVGFHALLDFPKLHRTYESSELFPLQVRSSLRFCAVQQASEESVVMIHSGWFDDGRSCRFLPMPIALQRDHNEHFASCRTQVLRDRSGQHARLQHFKRVPTRTDPKRPRSSAVTWPNS